MKFVTSINNIIEMLENESIIEKKIINEIIKDVKSEQTKREKDFKLDNYFITLDKENELVSVIVYKGTGKTGKVLDSFKAEPDKVIESILYNISDAHKKYLEKEIEKIKTGEKYIQG